MFIRRIGSRVIVAYDSIEDAIAQKSCMACERYKDDVPCRFYAMCRASITGDEEPLMFSIAGEETILNRCTIVHEGVYNGI